MQAARRVHNRHGGRLELHYHGVQRFGRNGTTDQAFNEINQRGTALGTRPGEIANAGCGLAKPRSQIAQSNNFAKSSGRNCGTARPHARGNSPASAARCANAASRPELNKLRGAVESNTKLYRPFAHQSLGEFPSLSAPTQQARHRRGYDYCQHRPAYIGCARE
jgi:hypothetical protein